MIKVEEWIKETREKRTIHLALDEPCIERGGNSTVHRGVLAEYLDTDLPTKIDLCHACHNGKCSNPRHLYWGTRRENIKDSIENGTFISPYKRTLDKYGLEKMKEFQRIGHAFATKKRLMNKCACTPAAEGQVLKTSQDGFESHDAYHQFEETEAKY